MLATDHHPFLKRLDQAVVTRGTALCVGVDPHLDGLPPFLQQELAHLGAPSFVERWANTMLDAAAGAVPAVKLQSAFFQALGPDGLAVLQRCLRRARQLGLLTILDAKRGDIASTMAAYGRMAFDVMDADALTVTPYMGFDVVEPLLPWLRCGRGVYVVWITSNPGGTYLQNLRLLRPGHPTSAAHTQTFAEALLDVFEAAFAQHGVEHAYGLVLGVTKLNDLSPVLVERLRQRALLMPGLGPQGGHVSADLHQLVAGSAPTLVPMSRGLLKFASDPKTWDEFAALFSSNVRTMAAQLAVSQ